MAQRLRPKYARPWWVKLVGLSASGLWLVLVRKTAAWLSDSMPQALGCGRSGGIISSPTWCWWSLCKGLEKVSHLMFKDPREAQDSLTSLL